MTSKYLKSKDLKAIHSWIKKVKQNKEEKIIKDGSPEKLKLDYKPLAQGSHRIIFDLSAEYILKVALSGSGMEENTREINVYWSLPPSLRKHLAEIKDYGEGWIIMEKARNNMQKTSSNAKKIRALHKKFEERGIIARDILTKKKKLPKWQNIGVNKKGRFLVIDYGAFLFKSCSVLSL